MKKLKVVLVGSEDTNYEQVNNSERLPKWDFKSTPEGKVLECIILQRKQLNSNRGAGTYMLFIVVHRHSKVKYVVTGNKVLEDRMAPVPDTSAVKIVYEGKAGKKEYDMYNVYRDKNFKYNPDIWESIAYEESPAQQPQTNAPVQQNKTVNAPAQNTTRSSAPIEEDMPF